MLYVGRVWLHYTDTEIWALTPRQFYSQLKVRQEYVKSQGSLKTSENAETGYIDEVPGW